MLNIQERAGQLSVVQIDGAAELDTTKYARTFDNRAVFEAHRRDCEAGGSWYAGNRVSIDHALYNGWPEGQARIESLSDAMREILPAPKSYRRRQRWMEDGDEPSWEREQSGYTDIWRTSRRDVMTGPTTVELYAPWGGHAGRRAEELQWDGVVLVVLTNLLEEAGYRVGASVNYASSWGFFNEGREQLVQVIVKRPEMPLDIATMTPIVAHPGVLRWHGLNAISTAHFPVGTGHGRPVEIAAIKQASILRQDGIVLNHAYYEEAAKQEILRVLAMFQDGHPHAAKRGALL